MAKALNRLELGCNFIGWRLKTMKFYLFFFSIEVIFDSSKKIVVLVHIDLIFKSIRTESKLYRLLDLCILKL